MLGLDAPDRVHDPGQRGVPGDLPEPPGGRRVPLHRVQQAVGVAALQVPLDPLRAELALVERELVPGLEAHDLVVADLELDAALLAAEAAVGLHDPVDLEAGVPATRRGPVQVRPEPFDELLVADRGPGHQPNPPTRADWARVTPARRHGGQVSW